MAAEPQLTPACELAIAVAREGVQATPSLEAPVALRNFLGAPRVSRRAMAAAQRVLDGDEPFRRRVAEQATEESVGRAGWLWLHRPEGWDAELAQLTGRGPVAAPLAAEAVPDGDQGSTGIELVEATVDGGLDAVEPAASVAGAGTGQAEPVDQTEAVGDAGDAGTEPRGAVGAQVDDGPVVAREPVRTSEIEQELHALRSLVERLLTDGGYRAGAIIRQLEADLAAVGEERDHLASALTAVTGERDQALARVEVLSDRLAGLRAELEDMTAQRAGFRTELERVLQRHAEVTEAQQALVAELSEQLSRALEEREVVVVELARSNDRIERVRHAVELAVSEAGQELQHGLVPSLGSAAEAVASIGEAVEQAVQRAQSLQDELSASVASLQDRSEAPQAPEPAGIEHADLGNGRDRLDAADGDGAAPVDGEREPGNELLDLLREPGAASEQRDPLDGFDHELSQFSRELSDALAPHLADPSPRDAAPGSPAEATPSGWLEADGGGSFVEAGGGTATGDAVDWESLVEPRREAWTNPGEGPSNGRQPVQVPAELIGDPLATARFLVSVPEVVLIIEGDTVATLGWPTLTVAEQRDALVSYLGDLAGASGAAADVVFDGAVGDESTLPLSDLVRVRLTVPGVASGRAVAELVDTYPVDWPVVIVTDDPSLELEAGRRGAAALSNLGLLDLFIAQ